ncbi:hypothetical protein Dacsa_0872 [Dactylococcopsis salina PCC 8305]|uniref:Uncharacterized protein n=1 Tax=Dactylococcopsis salina (strain PCC 8305) TaxID=13035 RepID=K9YSX8_DACS8|nr:hypothetical protein Dacsa_0872 [Dactylococcopsis salina PCC 8305]
MEEKKYSWKGSPNAGAVLSLLALFGGIAVILLGFIG